MATRRARSPSGSPPRWRRPLRLALLSALSTAAEEITSQLAPGAVDVRLRGGDIGFVVSGPGLPPEDVDDRSADPGPAAAPATGTGPDTDDGGTARITLRVPEQLKARIEDAAAREGFSVNTWLTRAVDARPRAGRRRPPRPTGAATAGRASTTPAGSGNPAASAPPSTS